MSVMPWQPHYDGPAPEHIEIPNISVVDILDQAAEKFGKHKAVIFQNLTLTYEQLRKKAEIFAASLRDLGVNPGDRVAIMLPNLPQTIISFWGALKAGATVVMTNPLYMEKELTHHFNDSNPKVLVTLDMFWNKVNQFRDKFPIEKYVVSRIADALAFPLNLLQPIQAKRSKTHVPVEYDGTTVLSWKSMLSKTARCNVTVSEPASTLALIQYTGGTTGFSKGAMLSHYNLVAQVKELMEVCRGDASTTPHIFPAIMPFFHVFGLVGDIILPAAYASPTIPIPKYVPHDVLEIIKKYRPTFFIGAPSIYISLMQQKNIADYDLTCINLCISGASPFPTVSMKKFQDMTQAYITEGFGLTEASPVVIASPCYGRKKEGSIGVPIPLTEAKIMDLENGTKELGDNEIGELAVRGPQVMLGYWNNPVETANTLRDGWLYTGDIAYRDEDGYYYIVDRKKDMAIIGGYNVFPSEVDDVLFEHPKVQDVVSLSVPHRSKGETLKAYVVPKPGEKLTSSELIAFCRQKLASYKVPRLFEFRDELPKSMVGKVLRRALREEEVRKQADEEAAEKNAAAVPSASAADAAAPAEPSSEPEARS